jgi:hypothetical protein
MIEAAAVFHRVHEDAFRSVGRHNLKVGTVCRQLEKLYEGGLNWIVNDRCGKFKAIPADVAGGNRVDAFHGIAHVMQTKCEVWGHWKS